MFYIADGRKDFYQWDLDRRLSCSDEEVIKAHYYYNKDTCLTVERKEDETGYYFEVPNILLQNAGSIRIYAYCSDYTKIEQQFKVNKRPKPDNYIYTETEIYKIEEVVENALKEAKESGEFDGPPGPQGPRGNVGPKGEKGDKGDPVEVVQATGESTEKAMSQKATTDALANKVDKITTSGNRIYATYGNAVNSSLFYDMSPASKRIPQRTADGQIRVPSIPLNNDEATSKEYVDTCNNAIKERVSILEGTLLDYVQLESDALMVSFPREIYPKVTLHKIKGKAFKPQLINPNNWDETMCHMNSFHITADNYIEANFYGPGLCYKLSMLKEGHKYAVYAEGPVYMQYFAKDDYESLYITDSSWGIPADRFMSYDPPYFNCNGDWDDNLNDYADTICKIKISLVDLGPADDTVPGGYVQFIEATEHTPYEEIPVKVTAIRVLGDTLLSYPYKISSGTSYGVTHTVYSDGSVILTGRASQDIYLELCDVTVPAGTYQISGIPEGANRDGHCIQLRWGYSGILFEENRKYYNSDTDTRTATICIKKNTVLNQVKYKLSIREFISEYTIPTEIQNHPKYGLTNYDLNFDTKKLGSYDVSPYLTEYEDYKLIDVQKGKTLEFVNADSKDVSSVITYIIKR